MGEVVNKLDEIRRFLKKLSLFSKRDGNDKTCALCPTVDDVGLVNLQLETYMKWLEDIKGLVVVSGQETEI